MQKQKIHSVFLLILSVVLLSQTAISAAASAPKGISSAGASLGTGMFAAVNVANPLDENAARMAKQAGVNWIRAGVGYDSAGTRFAKTYSTAQQMGLQIIGIVSYWTVEADPSYTSSVDSFKLQDWERAVAYAQTVYPSIRVWEIWNEPTCSKYHYGYMDGTPEHYLDLLKSAYTILKTQDPSSTILGLGGAQLGVSSDLDFAKAVFSLGGAAFMDAISIHAYPYELNTGKTWTYYEQMWASELAQYGSYGKPLWVTETGLTSNQTSESDQADYLQKSYSFFKQSNVLVFSWYVLADDNQSVSAEGAWGLLRPDLTPKQSYTVYHDLVAQVANAPLNVVLASPSSSGQTLYSSPVWLGVQVTSGDAIQGANVTIYVNDTSACSGISDSSGHYACSYSLTQIGHTYLWHATASKAGYDPGSSQTWAFTSSAKITLYLIDAKTRSPVSGASVSLDGVFVDVTDSQGKLVIQGVSAGLHELAISRSGYTNFTTKLQVDHSVWYLCRIS